MFLQMISETFHQAAEQFADFLQRAGQVNDLVWSCRENVTGQGRKIAVHPSPPAVNRDLFHRHYDFGVRQGLGVGLEAFCFAGNAAYCCVWVPEDAAAADNAMFAGGLRFSYAMEPDESGKGRVAKRCITKAVFQLARLWCKLRGESPLVGDLPSRRELELRYR